MPRKLTISPLPMTFEAFQALGPERGRPLEDLGKNYPEEVEALERVFGPERPPFLSRKGRPPKGTEASPVQPRVVKMPPAFWSAMTLLARTNGLTLHAAMREALLKWTQDHTQPKAG